MATGGTGLAANAAEMAVVHVGGKAINLAEKNLADDSVKKEITITITDGQIEAVDTPPKNTPPKTTPPINKPTSKKRAAFATFITVLDTLNITEIAKNKITEQTQHNNIYNALKDNSNHIVNEVFLGVNTILNQKIDTEINQPMSIKEAAIAEVKEELSKSVEQLKEIKSQVSKDLIALYKIVE